MKESKISLLLLVSLSLLLLAFLVLFIWGFTYFKQSIDQTQSRQAIVLQDSSVTTANVRDSLRLIYAATVTKLNDELDSTRSNVDSIGLSIDAKLQDFNILKAEITAILQNTGSSASDLSVAREKIIDLQKRLEQWRRRYADVDEENKRLSSLLKQLSKTATGSIEETKKVLVNSKPVPEQLNSAASFTVTAVELKAMMQLDDRQQETLQALQTDELKGYFELKNAIASVPGTEMFVVVLQPDGKVLKQSVWDSGLFDTRDGKKIYSCKMRFDYNKGEEKKVNFSLSTDQYQKGNYILELYYDGKIIARATKSLS